MSHTPELSSENVWFLCYSTNFVQKMTRHSFFLVSVHQFSTYSNCGSNEANLNCPLQQEHYDARDCTQKDWETHKNQLTQQKIAVDALKQTVTILYWKNDSIKSLNSLHKSASMYMQCSFSHNAHVIPFLICKHVGQKVMYIHLASATHVAQLSSQSKYNVNLSK
ncbi:uncharacterized protein LACBIDRAFT_328040 [Laccaria bicolor S238N-H82]|uniref:Predicted protein n=1 Tax=Laccaria bicolor (strain S238N-H82 / ATCC MYA-4686) TaxID=486041 RepID=B0DE97_LACBS|nr:uncharacterized protein LACBIDRAFT_328040 [Laccaria bicolor S238N-H82]EDR07098.1 predicted protein [Laccaria bicolor S238N-H82]|eukprot:XP_001882029.1 predicted protein [Laccaria bicolor S238N-H82]